MSRDREPTDTIDLALSAYHAALIRAVLPDVRQSRQADFLKFIGDVLRGVREPSDAQVRSAIKHAAERYGRPQ